MSKKCEGGGGGGGGGGEETFLGEWEHNKISVILSLELIISTSPGKQ